MFIKYLPTGLLTVRAQWHYAKLPGYYVSKTASQSYTRVNVPYRSDCTDSSIRREPPLIPLRPAVGSTTPTNLTTYPTAGSERSAVNQWVAI
jgi:hypothetical protein